jgi:hypothetical protein
MPENILYPDNIQRALGIQTGDIITTSYNTGPYIIHHIHGPITYFTGVGHVVILDHPEISLTLSTPNAKRKGHGGFINNIRQVDQRWYSAQNDELFITRPQLAPAQPANSSTYSIPPNHVELLPTPPLYQLNPSVDYEAGPRRTWHCEHCNVDFNAIPTNRYWCRHDCEDEPNANEIFYVRAPKPDDRRHYISYYLMTLNSSRYSPLQGTTAATSPTIIAAPNEAFHERQTSPQMTFRTD